MLSRKKRYRIRAEVEVGVEKMRRSLNQDGIDEM